MLQNRKKHDVTITENTDYIRGSHESRVPYHKPGTLMIIYVDFEEKYALFPKQMTIYFVST